MTADRQLAGYWARRQAKLREVHGQGKVYVEGKGRKCHVALPKWNEAFAVGARELAGVWHQRAGIWSFSINSKRLVLDLITRHYGEGKVQDDE